MRPAAAVGSSGLGELEARGQTAIALGEAHRVIAVFGLADQPRAEAAAAVSGLRAAGVGRIVMLTGNNEPVAAAVPARVGADEHRAGCSPRTSCAPSRP